MDGGYRVGRLPAEAELWAPCGAFDPAALPAAWAALEEAPIDKFPWDENGYRPPAAARVGWNERGLHVLLYADEPRIRAEVTECGGPACQDSCLEFFLAPNPQRPAWYWNIECTPRPAVHWGEGEGRHGRTVFRTIPEGVRLSVSRHEGRWWAVRYTLPADLLARSFGVTLTPGLTMRGNFYKCGDRTEKAHYGMWRAYDRAVVPKPDFHRPELFVPLTLA